MINKIEFDSATGNATYFGAASVFGTNPALRNQMMECVEASKHSTNRAFVLEIINGNVITRAAGPSKAWCGNFMFPDRFLLLVDPDNSRTRATN